MNSNRKAKLFSFHQVYGSEKGLVLPVALVFLVVLGVMGAAAVMVTRTGIKIAANYKNSTAAFNVAEAGIEHARGKLVNLSPSAVLSGTALFAGGNSGNLADGSYTVEVWNNTTTKGFPRGPISADLPSGSCNPTPTKDCDRILVVRSIGSYKSAQRPVEVVMRVPVPAPFWGAVYIMDGPDAPNPVEMEDFEPASGSSINGNDCNPPAVGGGAGPGPHVPGIAVQGANAHNDIVTDLGADLPFVTGVNGAGDVQIVPDAMNDEDLQVWVTTLIAAATTVGTGACGGSDPKEFGTWSDPQICHAQTSGSNSLDTLIPIGSSGAGILIVNDLDTSASANSSTVKNFTYEGIVIVVGDGRFRLQGTSRIYGTVIQKNIEGNHSGETRLRVRDDSRICYSSLAVRHVQGVLRPTMLAWYEG